jgi:hypothetical protein
MPGTPGGEGRKNVRGHAGRRAREIATATKLRREPGRRDAANALPNKSAARGLGERGERGRGGEGRGTGEGGSFIETALHGLRSRNRIAARHRCRAAPRRMLPGAIN